MILLDTNVVSEVMRPAPSPAVIAWLDGEEASTLYLSSVTVAEIAFGLQALPAGKRRRTLTERFELFVERGFDQRILPFDLPAARIYGELMGQRRAIGRPLSVLDGQIAATARAHRAAVATGNVRDFEGCGLRVIDPFAARD